MNNAMPLIHALTILLVFQLMGEISVLYFSLPIPGPVLGMLMLFLTLLLRNRVHDSLESTASGLLEHLSLLFIPAGVGIMVHFDRIESEWFAIAMALIVSTVITFIGSAGIMVLMERVMVKPDDKGQQPDG